MDIQRFKNANINLVKHVNYVLMDIGGIKYHIHVKDVKLMNVCDAKERDLAL